MKNLAPLETALARARDATTTALGRLREPCGGHEYAMRAIAYMDARMTEIRLEGRLANHRAMNADLARRETVGS